MNYNFPKELNLIVIQKGKLMLRNSKTHRDNFEQGNEDYFEVEAIDVGEIKMLRIGHDGAGFGAGKFIILL